MNSKPKEEIVDRYTRTTKTLWIVSLNGDVQEDVQQMQN